MSKQSWPRCPHPKRDGTVCGSASRPSADNVTIAAEDGFCVPHAPIQAAEIEDVHTVDIVSAEIATDSPQVASLREGLRGTLSTEAMVELMNSTLFEALQASKDQFTTCPHCSKRHPVSLPDLGVRATAVKNILELLEGRMREERSDEEQRTDREVKLMHADNQSLTNDELAEKILLLERELTQENAEE